MKRGELEMTRLFLCIQEIQSVKENIRKGGANMASTEQGELAAKMDAAAAEAKLDLAETIIIKAGTGKDVAKWMEKWFPTAGYKRLSRILVEWAKTPGEK